MTKCFFSLNPLLILSFFFSLPVLLFSQGLIINEASNNAGLEYVELLVIGSAADPTGSVDVTGWFIDDDNGDFSMVNSPSTSRGAMFFDGSCFSTLNPGDLILIYNENGASPSITLADDETDANGDGIYVLPGNSACFNFCVLFPSGTNPAYNCGAVAGSGIWSSLSLRDDGDVIQVRQPNGDFFHGFSYGDINTMFPAFPLGGASSFNLGGGNGFNYSFICGDFTTASNYITTGTAADTPGAPNSPENAATIREIKAGRFDYTDLANVDNCGVVLSTKIEAFRVKLINNLPHLSWSMTHPEQEGQFIIEKTIDGKTFQPIHQQKITPNKPNYTFIDTKPIESINIYRLKALDTYGFEYVSNYVSIQLETHSLGIKNIYPQPALNELNFSIQNTDYQKFNIRILDYMGREIKNSQEITNSSGNYKIDINSINKGVYFLQIQHSSATYIKKWIKK